jgi:hypothetical protein
MPSKTMIHNGVLPALGIPGTVAGHPAWPPYMVVFKPADQSSPTYAVCSCSGTTLGLLEP